MKIKDVMNQTGLTERAIRFYVEKELIFPKKEFKNNREYIDFSEEDINILQDIALLRKSEFSIEEIQKLYKSSANIKELLNTKYNEVSKQHKKSQYAYFLLKIIQKNDNVQLNDLLQVLKDNDRVLEEMTDYAKVEYIYPIPEELKKWNWGPLIHLPVWLFCNNLYLGCLIAIIIGSIFMFGFFSFFINISFYVFFISVFMLGFSIYLCLHGNEIIWKTQKYQTTEKLLKKQNRYIKICLLACMLQFGVYGLHIGNQVYIAIINAKRPQAVLENVKQNKLFKELFSSDYLIQPTWKMGYDTGDDWGSRGYFYTLTQDEVVYEIQAVADKKNEIEQISIFPKKAEESLLYCEIKGNFYVNPKEHEYLNLVGGSYTVNSNHPSLKPSEYYLITFSGEFYYEQFDQFALIELLDITSVMEFDEEFIEYEYCKITQERKE